MNKGAQTRLRVMLVVIRTEGDPIAVASRVRAELRTIDPELPVVRINTADQHLDDVLGQDRLVAVLSARSVAWRSRSRALDCSASCLTV